MELTSLTLEEASRRVRDKSISPVELTRACLDRIERLNPKLNAFVTVTAEQALAQAKQLEAEQRRGQIRGSLHGIPIALKDLIDVAGVKTTAASAVFANNVATEDAAVVRRLRGAGAVLLGKLNMDEFAYNFTSETSHFGPIPQPLGAQPNARWFPPAALRRRWPRGFVSARWVQTPAVPSGSRRASATLPVSRRATDW